MEFMGFMEQFLRDHPEVVEDQQRGWDSYSGSSATPSRGDLQRDQELTPCPSPSLPRRKRDTGHAVAQEIRVAKMVKKHAG